MINAHSFQDNNVNNYNIKIQKFAVVCQNTMYGI